MPRFTPLPRVMASVVTLVTIASVCSAQGEIFADGFESGNVLAWTLALPLSDLDFDGWGGCDLTAWPCDCEDDNGSRNPDPDNDGILDPDDDATLGGDGQDFCNGVDDDCDGDIDEDGDQDDDGFSACSLDHALLDCNDTDASLNPGTTGSCTLGVEGLCPTDLCDGVDNDCDGYVDEGCSCDSIDHDGDGLSACDGDCNDDPNDYCAELEFPRSGAASETECDGCDNDCNKSTVEHCSLGDRCSYFPTDRSCVVAALDCSPNEICADGVCVFLSANDVCFGDLLCACALEDGQCHPGDQICTSYCQGSFTGPPGAGCSADQVCLFEIFGTANEHACGILGDASGSLLPIGSGLGGADCTGDNICQNACTFAGNGICDDGGPGASRGLCAYGSDCDDCGPRDNAPDDSQCRSGRCALACRDVGSCADCGAGEVCTFECLNPPCSIRTYQCCRSYCSDFCDHSDLDWSLGDVGEAGSCARDASCAILEGISDSHHYQYASCAPSGEGMGAALTGDDCSTDPAICRWGARSCVSHLGETVCAEPCKLQSHCPTGYYCGLENLPNGNEVVPVCLAYPSAGAFDRPAGAACSQNSDCVSNFCRAVNPAKGWSSICLEMCTDDAGCPGDLSCETAYVELPSGPVTRTRVCLDDPDPNNDSTEPYQRIP